MEERAGLEIEGLIVQGCTHRPLEEVYALVLTGVYMKRGPGTRRDPVLEHRVGSAGVLGPEFHRHEDAGHHPDGSALVVLDQSRFRQRRRSLDRLFGGAPGEPRQGGPCRQAAAGNEELPPVSHRVIPPISTRRTTKLSGPARREQAPCYQDLPRPPSARRATGPTSAC